MWKLSTFSKKNKKLVKLNNDLSQKAKQTFHFYSAAPPLSCSPQGFGNYGLWDVIYED